MCDQPAILPTILFICVVLLQTTGAALTINNLLSYTLTFSSNTMYDVSLHLCVVCVVYLCVYVYMCVFVCVYLCTEGVGSLTTCLFVITVKIKLSS